MRVFINSVEREVPEQTAVLHLLELIKLSNQRVAVEVNKELVTKQEWPMHILKSGDRIEIVSFVGGG